MSAGPTVKKAHGYRMSPGSSVFPDGNIIPEEKVGGDSLHRDQSSMFRG